MQALQNPLDLNAIDLIRQIVYVRNLPNCLLYCIFLSIPPSFFPPPAQKLLHSVSKVKMCFLGTVLRRSHTVFMTPLAREEKGRASEQGGHEHAVRKLSQLNLNVFLLLPSHLSSYTSYSLPLLLPLPLTLTVSPPQLLSSLHPKPFSTSILLTPTPFLSSFLSQLSFLSFLTPLFPSPSSSGPLLLILARACSLQPFPYCYSSRNVNEYTYTAYVACIWAVIGVSTGR